MTKDCKSDTLAAIHETAAGLHSIGLMDTQAMQQFDDACLAPGLSAADIRALRQHMPRHGK